jgi:hypothetical protein
MAPTTAGTFTFLSEALFVTIGNVEFEFRDLDFISGWDIYDG